MDLQPQIADITSSIERLKETLFSLTCLQAFAGKNIDDTAILLHVYEPDDEVGLIYYSHRRDREDLPSVLFVGDTFDRTPKIDGYVVEPYELKTMESIHDDHYFHQSFLIDRYLKDDDTFRVTYAFYRVSKTPGPDVIDLSSTMEGAKLKKLDAPELRV